MATKVSTNNNGGQNQAGSGKSFVRKSNRAIDLTKKKFVRLRVLYDSGRRVNKKIMWVCRCKCGNLKEVRSDHLIHGRVVSCGCYSSDLAKKLAKLGDGAIKRTHGKSHTKVYAVYRAMLQRCNNPNAEKYHDYGGRGITVCRRWAGERGFEHFLADMGLPPKNRPTLDRRDNNGPYSPDNCRWATRSKQMRNRRFNRKVIWQGKTWLLIDLAESYGIPYKELHRRHIQRGWTLHRSIHQPFRKPKG